MRKVGVRTYRTGRGEYLTLKKGSKERGVGPFKQTLWEELDTHWTLVNFGGNALKMMKSVEDKAEPKIKLKDYEAQDIFAWLLAGYEPARIVKETGYHPDIVEYATKRYLELKGLRPEN